VTNTSTKDDDGIAEGESSGSSQRRKKRRNKNLDGIGFGSKLGQKGTGKMRRTYRKGSENGRMIKGNVQKRSS